METRRRANPFLGLRPFTREEADLFFGRDRQSDDLVRRLAGRRFLAVVGTSGSGKSSLVRAGLLPALEGGFMAGAGAHWQIATLRPQDDPIGYLARGIVETGALAHLNLSQPAAEGVIETTLRRSSLGLVEVARLARLAAHENLLILVDQFEELFRFADLAKQRDAGDEAPAFVKLLLEAAQQTDVPLYVVITMRSDFLGDCDRFRGLPEAISESQYLIPRLTRDELQSVITGPIGVRGGRIASSLLQRLLNDVGDDMDQLPVLQHALMRTWDHWEHDTPETRPVDLSDLEAIGGMADALSRHADEAYESFATDRDHSLIERLFKCLTERGPDNREIRRPTPLARIAAIAEADPAEVIPVIEGFRAPGRSFLMPPQGVALDGDSVIDISHESLIRQWARLRTWVDAEAESRATYLRVVEAARLRRAGKASLWGEPDLTYARQWIEREKPNAQWAERYNSNFDEAMAFLRESEAAHAAGLEQERQRAEAERMRERERLAQAANETLARERDASNERELKQAKALAAEQKLRADLTARAAGRLRVGLIVLGAVVAVGVVLGVYAFKQTRLAAEQSRRAAEQSRLAANRLQAIAEERSKALVARTELLSAQLAARNEGPTATTPRPVPPRPQPSVSPRPPTKHLIVLMLESRSFDHMLGYLKSPSYDIEGLTGGEKNNRASAEFFVKPLAQYQGMFNPDPAQRFQDVDEQIFNGDNSDPRIPTMGGFINSYARLRNVNPQRIMNAFKPEKLPVLTTLATEFAICDHWFSSFPGPSLPNRAFAHYGTSFGHVGMDTAYSNATYQSIFDRLVAAGHTAKLYLFDQANSTAEVVNVLQKSPGLASTYAQFLADANSGQLPEYSFVEPNFLDHDVDNGAVALASDQHPDHHVLEGERFIASVYNAIRSNETLWRDSILLITYSNHGGFYDHVPPPSSTPDGFVAQPKDTGTGRPFNFDRLGVRVPAVIVSPYIAKATIDHTVYDHASIPATASKLFSIGAPRRSPREQKAQTFDTVLTLSTPRKDAPSFAFD